MINLRTLRDSFNLAVVLLLFAAAAPDEQARTVVDKGTSTAESGIRTSYTVELFHLVHPGMTLTNDFTQFGEGGQAIASSTQYYYAGVEGKTLHIYKINREYRGMGMSPVERERLPILLPLAVDDSVNLVVRPLVAKSFVVRLKKNSDHSLSATVVK